MRRLLLAGCCLLVLVACGGGDGNRGGDRVTPPPPPTRSASEQLAEDLQGLDLGTFYDVSIEALLRRSPETILWRSLDDIYPLAEAELDNLSDDFQRETYAMYQVALDALRTYDRSILDPDAQLDYDVYEHHLQDVVDRMPFMYNDFAATYGIFGIQRSTQQLFTEIHPLETAQDAENYVARLANVETKFNQLGEHLQLQRTNGVIEPSRTMQMAINELEVAAGQQGVQSPYYTALAREIYTIPDLDATRRDELLQQTIEIVNGSIRPGHTSLLSTLKGLLPHAPAQIGVGQYANGAEYYRYALRHHTTTDLTAAEIHQLGLAHLDRLQAEMRVIFDELGYPQDESLQQLFSRVAVDGGTISGANVKSTYEAIIDLAEQGTVEAFDIFPSSDVVVIQDPGGGGYYIGPSSDGTRPGAFYASTGTQPWYPMRSLAYHEAVPGHHTQIAIAMDQDRPMIRRISRSTGFIEGWALYAERLAWELGWHDDPYSDLGRLQYEALRAARLVIDTGIHSMGWSFQQAMQFNQDSIGASIGSSQWATLRYSVYPGQATAYMVGLLQILDERERAMAALGDRFDLKAFHRALLANGSVPLSLLDDIVDRYISESQN